MSGQSAKQRKTTAMASPGVPVTDCLPPELLDTILGFLDVRTLCTARLVCARFRGAASRCMHSVEISAKTLRCRPETNLNNFPNLSRVSVFDVRKEDLVMLAQSPVAAAVTHLRADEFFKHKSAHSAAGCPVLPLPNLTSLTVGCAREGVLLFPQTLRELILKDCVDSQTAELVAGMTNLTSLRIYVHDMRKPFKAVTALTALQRLEIGSALSLIPFVGELTLLTHLHFVEMWRKDSLSDFTPLARLRRLVHLRFRHFGYTSPNRERQVLASITTLTSLRLLDLTLCRRPDQSAFETVCMAAFSGITALRLGSGGLEAAFLPRFNMERLRDLRLSGGVGLDQDGVAALGRATGLTRLQVWTATVGLRVGPEEWEIALSRMSRLRALSLGAVDATFPFQAIAVLTRLTKLELNGRGAVTNAAGEVCLGLKKLRVLSMSVTDWIPTPSDRITPETFYAVAKMPELCKFDIFGYVGILDWGLRDGVHARLGAERHDKGWPPLQLRLCHLNLTIE